MSLLCGVNNHIPAGVYQAVGGSRSASEDSPVDAWVRLYYDLDGGVRIRYTTQSAINEIDKDPWSPLHPAETGGAGWHIRVTHTSDTNQYDSGSGLGAWLDLASNRSWKFSKSGVGSNSGHYLIELSDDGGSTVFDSASLAVNLTVETP